MVTKHTCLTAVLAFILAVPVAAFGQAGELPMGSPATGTASSSQPAVYDFSAGSAGFLTVVARAVGETDLVLVLADTTGQPLPEGRSDQDLMGNTGAEQMVFTIPRAGDYQVRVETFSGGGDFRIVASWIPFPEAEQAADPDGTPDAAQPLTPGSPVQDSIDPPAGDAWDWFKVTAESAGIITVPRATATWPSRSSPRGATPRRWSARTRTCRAPGATNRSPCGPRPGRPSTSACHRSSPPARPSPTRSAPGSCSR